jgi:copper transport protein
VTASPIVADPSTGRPSDDVRRLIISRLLRLVVALFAVVSVQIGAFASPASAHAQLTRTVPEQGAQLATAPTSVTVEFNEPVRAAGTGIQVFAADQARVDSGTTSTEAKQMRIALKPLPEGAYVVVWQGVSLDGHPIRGSFTFQVGEGDQSAVAGIGDSRLSESDADPLLGLLRRIGRAVFFVLATMLLGAAIWTAAGLPLLSPLLGPSGFRLAGLGALVAGMVSVFVDGPYVEGRSIGAAFDPTVIGASLGRLPVRVLLGAALVSVLLAGSINRTRTSDDHGSRLELPAGAAMLALLLGASGHAAASSTLVVSVVVTALHIAAGATWVAGVVGVVILLARRSLTAESFTRWSRLAQWSVAALVTTGVANAWKQVGSIAALRDTTYGRILVTKLLLVGVMLLLGARHRAGVATLSASSVAAEALTGVVVIVISTVLSATVPARAEVSKPISLRAVTQSTTSDLTVSPARIGLNVVHLYTFDRNGRTLEMIDAQFTFTHPGTGTVLEVDPYAAGRGHEQASGVNLPFPGAWKITAKVFITDFDVETAEATFVVKG